MTTARWCLRKQSPPDRSSVTFVNCSPFLLKPTVKFVAAADERVDRPVDIFVQRKRQRAGDDAGAAGKRFVFHAPFVSADRDATARPLLDEVNVRSSGRKYFMVSQRGHFATSTSSICPRRRPHAAHRYRWMTANFSPTAEISTSERRSFGSLICRRTIRRRPSHRSLPPVSQTIPSSSRLPCDSAKRAKQRAPLPHISASPPSAL